MTAPPSATRGLVIGKFLPPHVGHLRLVRFAQAMVDDLQIVVGSLPSEPIPGVLRTEWMAELCPQAAVHHLADELPAYPDEHPDFWQLWCAALLRTVGKPPTHVFASESYGAELARRLGATFVPVLRPNDATDGPLATSGTAIRQDPWKHWDHIPDVVRPHFLRRIHVVGPESVGKSRLCAQLAAEFNTVWVPEYARTWLTREGTPMDGETAKVAPEDMIVIARGHLASQRALERSANRRIFLDTDVLATSLWSAVLHGATSETVERLAATERPDLTLLLDVDVPYVPDTVRYLPEERRSFFDRYEALLQSAGRPYTIIRGSFRQRINGAIEAVQAVPPPPPMP